MLDFESVFDMIRVGQYGELHRRLDEELESASSERRQSIAHWRAHALISEQRFEDAIEHLRRNRSDYLCRTSAYAEAAELLDLLGRNVEAQAEMADAPIDTEVDRFPVLVMDAQFMCLLIRVRGGHIPSDQELAAFPDDFGTVVLPGRPFRKSDLVALVDQQRRRPSRTWTF